MLKHVMPHVKELAHEAASKALESKAVALSVAATTAALGRSELQSMAQLYATIAGGILTTVLIIKHTYEAYAKYKEDMRKQNENIVNQK